MTHILMDSGRRRGISLMEVLMSIGVLSIGLLGVASLIPVAGHQAEEGIRNERMAAAGKRAFREIHVAGLLHPDRWKAPKNGASAIGSPPGPKTVSTTLVVDADLTTSPVYRRPVPVCIDPRYFQFGVPSLFGSVFCNIQSAGHDVEVVYAFPWMSPDPDFPVDNSGFLQYSHHLDELFVAQDDLVFDLDDRPKLPPIGTVLRDGVAPLKRHSSGKFSWMALAVPENQIATTSNTYQGRYQVSVAVYHNRDARGTRRINFEIATIDGWGGGEAKFRSPLPPRTDLKKLKAIEKNSWVLVGGVLPIQTPEGFPYAFYDLQWYRIVSMDWGTDQTPWAPPTLMLAGPDWRIVPGINNAKVYAFFPFDGNKRTVLPWNIVSVYTKTMRLH